MKQVINLIGKKEMVPDNTVVNTINGIHYLLPQSELDTMKANEILEAKKQALAKIKKPIDQMRAKRDMLLAQSDFAVLSDAPLTALQVTSYKKYRTHLRDLPKVFPTGANVIYPTKPK